MHKKVLFIVNHDVVIYNFRKELVEELLVKNFDVYISSPYGPKIDKLIQIGCHFIETRVNRRGTNILQDLKLIKTYNKLIADIKPDIVLTYTIKPNIYGGIAAKKNGIPYIANITGLGSATKVKGIMQKIIVKLYRFSFSKVNIVFFQNQDNQQFFEKNKIAIGKHLIIPGSGVNVNHFHYSSYPDDKIVEFAFISRIMKEKGIELYLETAKFFKSKYSNTEFHICGFCEEDYLGIIEEYENKEIVKYHGMVDDIRDILRQVHCVVHPTNYPEGMSNVLLEAASMGRVIIASNRAGCREIIDENLNGYLVEPDNLDNLIYKIEKFLNMSYEQKKQMGINGRVKIEKHFNREIVIDEYMRVINDLLK